MAPSLRSTIDTLIRRHFPWGEPGSLPEPPRETDQRRRLVEGWLAERTRDCAAAALALVARVGPILREVEAEIGASGEHRLVARIDLGAAAKSPPGILEKMAREWMRQGSASPPVSFEDFRVQIDDLARFRIVTNFLSDVELLAERLEAPFHAGKGLSPWQRELAQDYRLRDNALADSVHLHPRRREKGERCRRGVFIPRRGGDEALNVEVQIQTLLQEAWDRKDHYLLYEPRRRGERVDDRHECEMFAMSEVLYVADLTFDRLRESMRRRRRRKPGARKGGRRAGS